MEFSPEQLAGFIDHTLLKPDAMTAEIEKLCGEALRYHFASVCVNPVHIPQVAQLLKGLQVKPCCVVGFPLGATMPEVKAYETQTTVKAGAREIDMVINIAAVKSGDKKAVWKDIEAVCEAASSKAIVKVIIETCLLSNEEKRFTCEAARDVGAAFVKTSTGFSTAGATAEDVSLMRAVVGKSMGVKASGGIRSLESLLTMLAAGADRIGSSSGVNIIEGLLNSNECK